MNDLLNDFFICFDYNYLLVSSVKRRTTKNVIWVVSRTDPIKLKDMKFFKVTDVEVVRILDEILR